MLTVAGMAFTSCEDKLDIPQKASLTTATFYQTDDDAEPEVRDLLLADIWAKTAELTGITEAELDANADAFLRTFDTP